MLLSYLAKGPTKLPKHHYIPVLYLSQWADGNGRLYEFSRPNGRSEVSVRPTGPKGTEYERGLYRLTGVPEDASEAVERKFMAQVDSLAKKALDVLLGEDTPAWTVPLRSAWSRFVTGLIFRNPERVREARKFLEDFWLHDYDNPTPTRSPSAMQSGMFAIPDANLPLDVGCQLMAQPHFAAVRIISGVE
jgi:hypothetical protein